MRVLRFFSLSLVIAWFSVVPPCALAAEPYVPPAGSWERKKPSDLGMDDAKIAEAVAWALTQETDWPKDFSKQAEIFGRPLGPLPSTRAGTNGIILKDGYIIAEFGDVHAVDPTYSVAKSYLSTTLGLSIDRGIIGSIDERVGERVNASLGDNGFVDPAGAPAHNALVTWKHFVTMTSEWRGEMFGKTHDFPGAAEYGKSAMQPRELRPPGTFFEYNDVRINRFALSMLRLWKKPLPDVWRDEVMNPIGASPTWKWIPYDNAMVEVDVGGTKQMMPSISGGTRWGGGLWINTLDHARFGLLISRGGKWGDRQIVSEQWIREATKQQGVKSDYGYLWWLNNEGRWPAAPRSSFSAQGAGDNTIWIDNEHGLVVVWRWHKGSAQGELYSRIIGAVGAPVDSSPKNPPTE
jgi:CubicO group peptidase (beta-lactamase class C family)